MPPPNPAPTLLEIANRLDCVLLAGDPKRDLAVFARIVHEAGPHAAGRFIALDATAVPETLFAAELFGFFGGALYRGDGRRRMGRVELASGGTLFVNNVDSLGLDAQAQLLNALNVGEATPLRGDTAYAVSTRLIAGTHSDLAAAVLEGRFRRDLYERLAATLITVPPAAP